MKVLITGSNGSLGKSLVKSLASNKFTLLTPTSQELNLLNQNQVFDFVKSNKPNLIIHLAGISQGLSHNDINYNLLFKNTCINSNIIEASRLNNIRAFINISSSTIYSLEQQMPFKESEFELGRLEKGKEGYSLSKIISIKLIENLNKINDYPYKTIVLPNMYGPYEDFSKGNLHFIPSIIKKLNGNEDNIKIWGSGQQKRQIIYTDNLADYFNHFINNYESLPNLLNVSSEYNYTMTEYYVKIAEILKISKTFTNDLSMPEGIIERTINTDKFKSLSLKEKFSFEESIIKTNKSFLEYGQL